jgi:hypothetical protein
MKHCLQSFRLALLLLCICVIFSSCSDGDSGGSAGGGGVLCATNCTWSQDDPCAEHGGTNCLAGPNKDDFVVCNDGWQYSNVVYYCRGEDPVEEPVPEPVPEPF